MQTEVALEDLMSFFFELNGQFIFLLLQIKHPQIISASLSCTNSIIFL